MSDPARGRFKVFHRASRTGNRGRGYNTVLDTLTGKETYHRSKQEAESWAKLMRRAIREADSAMTNGRCEVCDEPKINTGPYERTCGNDACLRLARHAAGRPKQSKSQYRSWIK